MKADTVCGVDGCKGGWLVVRWDGEPRSSPVGEIMSFADVLDLKAGTVAIDIPIGFPERIEHGGREADRLVRKELGRKGSAVFPSPARAALAAASHREASSLNAENSPPPGIGVSIFTYMLFPKMNEVDAAMTPAVQARIYEAHPELSFQIMNGGVPLAAGKKTRAGQEERRDLLRRAGFPIGTLVPPSAPKRLWQMNDLFDACACAWVARRIRDQQSIRFPADPPRDAKGLRMEINA